MREAKLRSGKGSANRITAHADCPPYPGHRFKYRTKVDVDVIGALDPPDKQYFNMRPDLPTYHYECSALGVDP